MSIEPHVIEHLKNFAGLVIDQYHEGTAEDPASAKMRIWQELQRCLGSTAETLQIKGHPYWIRLAAKNTDVLMSSLAEAVKGLPDTYVAAFRWLGPRQGNDGSVAWTVLDVPDYEVAVEARKVLEDMDVEVRDGNFGGLVL